MMYSAAAQALFDYSMCYAHALLGYWMRCLGIIWLMLGYWMRLKNFSSS